MKNISLFTVFIFLSIASFSNNESSKLWLPSIFGNNMMMQQKTEAKIWGKAPAGKTVHVQADWNAVSDAISDNSGNWKLTINTPAAGGPYKLKIATDDTTITFQNVLIGDVWFCSGQSNMEMPMTGWLPNNTIENSAKEIAAANYPDIRLFIVQRAVAAEPTEDCIGHWEVCTPETVKPFSATAYFFGKDLHNELKIPIGLIESTWGGTPVEAWMSEKELRNQSEFVDEISAIRKDAPKVQAFMVWMKKHKSITLKSDDDPDKWKNLDFNDESCSSVDFDDSKWPEMKLPQNFENVIGDFDGVVWFRKKIEIPDNYEGGDLTISLGPIDDMDRTYFNGVLVGTHEELGYYQVDRNYTIPAALVKKGNNTIAVRVVDNTGGGGLWGTPDKLKLVSNNSGSVNISLAGEWKLLPVADFMDNKFYLYDIPGREFYSTDRPKILSPYTPTVLYNGMVHPVIPFNIKGAIWYQGEANVGRSQQYAKLFPAMIESWRADWKIPGFPFYYVQIAPYEYSNADSSESAELRYSQTSALKLPNTGMVVTLDIATVKNIHPPYKSQVGQRLANYALAKTYGENIPYSGPVYKSMKKEGKTIRISFDFTDGGLVAKNNELKEFEIAGKDGKFVPAKAKIDKNEVVVWSDSVADPVAVRYCWHNGSQASLFNKNGLPAEQFRAN